MPETVDIGAEAPDQPEILALLAASDAFSAALYPSESSHMADLATLRQRDLAFLVARIGGRAVGYVEIPPCGSPSTSTVSNCPARARG
jgi:hypothetical protein